MRKILVLLGVALGSVLAFQYWEYRARLGLVPPCLQVSRLLYAKEKVWGWGPGGHEAGLLVFALPDSIALNPNFRQACPLPWLQTPGDRPLAHFLNSPSFDLSIDPALATAIDQAFRQPGSYYHRLHPGRLLLVIPSQKRVVYAYAG
ncbi:MAG TPA: hypothetical protein DCQ32_06595 [Cyanobacteria bacterium UBA8156]|jgi:hypothetical protein|nr:hypothetical protein [Cyanobacteria bacterium UBA8156]